MAVLVARTPDARRISPFCALRHRGAALAVLVASAAWAVLFGWLSVVRHLAGGSHAEDLGFTDQVIANVVRGQWFRMSIYQGATWNTEIDLTHVARPDSLLAFHVEPMLLLFVPAYAFGAGATLLLLVQAVVVALGALPAYRIGTRATDSQYMGLVVAATYLLSPLGQWAVLADFHTSTLAGPLLLLTVERLVVAHRPLQAMATAALALSAREDVGPTVALLGFVVLLVGPPRHRAGLTLVAMGLAWTAACLLVLRHYAGSDSAFASRYAESLGGGPIASLQALTRPAVLQYGVILLLTGGWLGLIAPLLLLPALPSLAINTLSGSPWMASGQAHYSGLVLPFVVLAAADGMRRVRRGRPVVGALLLGSTIVAHAWQGAGPLGGNYAPAQLTEHAARARAMLDTLPPDGRVSASASLVPHLTHRARVYVFPAVEDATHVALDLRASPAPTSAGDVFLRVQALLSDGWHVAEAEDGLLLLQHEPATGADLDQVIDDRAPDGPSIGTLEGRLDLLSATLVPSPDASLEPDGPRWVLRTVWRARQSLPPGTRLEFWLDYRDGRRQHVWDIAHLWWYPPERWPAGQPIAIDIRDVPTRDFASWQASLSVP